METSIQFPKWEQSKTRLRGANIPLPSLGEISRALKTAQDSPEELTDRELWILNEMGDDAESPPYDPDDWVFEDGDF